MSQQVYLKLLFLQINIYTIFTRRQVYLLMICFMIDLQFPFIAEYEAIYCTSTIILVFLTQERLLQTWALYISHLVMSLSNKSKIIINHHIRTVLQIIINFIFPISIHPTSYKSHLQFFWNPISSHPVFQFCLDFIPSDWNSCMNLSLISSYWNSLHITMTTTRSNPKHGGMNVIIDEVYVVWASLTLMHDLIITPSCRHTGQIRLS